MNGVGKESRYGSRFITTVQYRYGRYGNFFGTGTLCFFHSLRYRNYLTSYVPVLIGQNQKRCCGSESGRAVIDWPPGSVPFIKDLKKFLKKSYSFYNIF
jgi:hypothetical protein